MFRGSFSLVSSALVALTLVLSATACSFDPYQHRASQQLRLSSSERARLLAVARTQFNQNRSPVFLQSRNQTFALTDASEVSAEVDILGLAGVTDFCWGVAVLPTGMTHADACDSRGIYSPLVSLATEGVDLSVPAGGDWTLAVYVVSDPSGNCASRTSGLPEWRATLDADLQYRLTYLYQYREQYEWDGGESAGLRSLNSADAEALLYGVVRVGSQTLDVFSDQEVTVDVNSEAQELEDPVCVSALQDSAEVLAIAVEESAFADRYSLSDVVSLQDTYPVPSPVPSPVPQVTCAPLQLQDGNGLRMVLWGAQTATTYSIYTTTYDENLASGWSSPVTVYSYNGLTANSSESFGCLQGSMNSHANAVILWTYYDGAVITRLKSLTLVGGTWGSAPSVLMGDGDGLFPSSGNYGVILNDLGLASVIARSADSNQVGALYVRSLSLGGAGVAPTVGPAELVPNSSVSGYSANEMNYGLQFKGNPKAGVGLAVGSIYRSGLTSAYEVPVIPGVSPTLTPMQLHEFGTDSAQCDTADVYSKAGLDVDSSGTAYLVFQQNKAPWISGACAPSTHWSTDSGDYKQRVLLRTADLSSLKGANANTPAPWGSSETVRYTTPLAVPTGAPYSYPSVSTAIAADGGKHIAIGWSEYDSMPNGSYTAIPRTGVARKLSGESLFSDPSLLVADGPTALFRPEVRIDSEGDITLVLQDLRYDSGTAVARLYGGRWLASDATPVFFVNDDGGLTPLDETSGGVGVTSGGVDLGFSFDRDLLGRGLLVWVQQFVDGSYSLFARHYH